MKKGFAFLFSLFFLSFAFLFSCTEESVSTEIPFSETEVLRDPITEEPLPSETVEKPEPEPEPEPEPGLPETEEPSPAHRHTWILISETKSTCTVAGKREYRCDCGKTSAKALDLAAHAYSNPTCTTGGICFVCGHEGKPPLGHSLKNKICTRCSSVIDPLKTPFFVLGRAFEMDEGIPSIVSKLGEPTERVTEGEWVSLIYAEDLTRLTVIQTDEYGLWGIFTLDPSAWVCFDGVTVDIATANGAQDSNSDAYFQNLSSYRIYNFRDRIGTGKNYGMWVLCQEYTAFYDYMNSDELYGTFYGQNRISYYYVNALRARHSIAPLTWSNQACEVANEYSAFMIENNFFRHDGSYLKRLQDKGLKISWAGENISQGYSNAYFVCDAYYNSASHRQNILDARFSYVGMGFQRKSVPLVVYGAQIFYS